MIKRIWQNMPRTRQGWLRILASYSVTLPLLAASFAYLLLVLQTGADSQRVEQLARLLTDRQAQAINSALGHLSQQVAHQASLPMEASGDTGERLPQAVSVQRIPLGPLGIADRNNPYLGQLRNNIEMDMLRRARAGGGTVVDAYPYQERWLISLAHPTETGVLLVSYPAELLQEVIRQHSDEDAETSITYRHQGQSRTIVSNRVEMPSNIGASRALDIEGWHIQVTPSQRIVDDFAERNIPLLIVALLCILVAVFNLVYGISTSNRLNIALDAAARRQKQDDDDAVQRVMNLAPTIDGSSLAQNRRQRQAQAASPPARPAETPAAPAKTPPPPPPPAITRASLPEASIFRAYDIRGIASTQLDAATCQSIGLALGSSAREAGQDTVLVARDGRNSSPGIRDNLVEGLLQTGLNVIDMGMIPTPVLHFASVQHHVGTAVMVTGSHNPANYNGLKMIVAGKVLTDQDIQSLRQRIENRDFQLGGAGEYQHESIVEDYIRYISHDIVIAQPLKVVIDAGNGVTGIIAPRLFSKLGCRVEPLFCEVDGDFPNHPPDPTVEANLSALKEAVYTRRADIGIAFDGDGDRVAIVTGSGRAIAADQLLMILAKDVVGRNPGAEVLFDVKCSRNLHQVISELGGRPTLWKCGHSYMKRKMAESGALLGGEYSGHIFFNERWFGFDDGMYAAARLLEILGLGASLDEELDKLPHSVSTPEILIPVSDNTKFALVEEIGRQLDIEGATIVTTDGIRMEFAGGWGLVRASNTTPALTLRFEADDQAELDRIRDIFRLLLTSVDSSLADGF